MTVTLERWNDSDPRRRVRRRAEALLRSAGFRAVRWQRLYAKFIAAVVAER